MPEIASFADLRRFSQNADSALIIKQASSSVSGKSVFLSHSTRDQELLPGVVQVLENHGGRVYVDKLDATLPTETSKDTAEKLRERIAVCPRFVMFVTPNSKDSRWIPWELGLADGQKRSAAVALFPSAETVAETRWTEQEFLGLYRRIVWGKLSGYSKEVWMVLDHRANSATELRNWLAGQD